MSGCRVLESVQSVSFKTPFFGNDVTAWRGALLTRLLSGAWPDAKASIMLADDC
jgi:hypothetical protein